MTPLSTEDGQNIIDAVIVDWKEVVIQDLKVQNRPSVKLLAMIQYCEAMLAKY